MANDISGPTELDDKIYTFDVSDVALEHAAAVADGQAVTIGRRAY